MTEAENAENAIGVWGGNENGAVYYTSKDSKQIKALTESLVGERFEGVNEFKMCVEADVTRDEPDAANYLNCVYQMTAEDKDAAEQIYESIAPMYSNHDDSSTGKSKGWTYTICAEETGSSEGISYYIVHGIYIKGNEVIYVYGITASDNDKTSIAYICKDLGLVSPYSLMK